MPIKRLSIFQKALFIFSLLIGICFWSSLKLDIYPWGTRWAYPLFIIYFFIISTNKSNIWKSYTWEFAGVIKWTIFTIFLAFIPAYIDWGQSIPQSIGMSLKWSWVLLLYFILRKWNMDTSTVMKYIIILSIIWVILEIGQQFTYPHYWFAGRSEEEAENIEQRMGMYRFYIWGVDFVMMAYAYSIGQFSNLQKRLSKKYLIIGTILFIGLLCYCSRKHIYVSLFAIGYFALTTKNKYKNYIRIFTALIILILFYNFYDSFTEMSQAQTTYQGEGEDFIRFLALKYYLFDFSNSPLYFWLGAGIPADNSALSQSLNYSTEVLRFYRADIGIFGYYSTFGILGVSAILIYIWKFIKNWRYIDLWLKMFFIMKLLLIVFDFWGMWNVGMMAYTIFLYITDLNIQKNKKQRTIV